MPGLRTARPATASSSRSALSTGSTVSYTNATDGVITLVSGATTATYRFTGIDPIDMTGSTVADLVFNLPGSTDTQLEDNGNPADGMSRLRDAGGGFDPTTFGHPTSSLTIHGTAGDSVTVTLVDSLGAADLTIGSVTDAALRPDSITVDNVVTSGTVNLAATGSIGEPVIDGVPDIVANAAALLAGGSIANLELQVSTVAAANTGSGFTDIINAGDLVVGTVSGIAGITAAGNISVQARGAGSTLANNAAVSAGAGPGTQVSLNADRMTLAGGAISAGAAVSLVPFTTSLAIDLGSQTDVAAGTLELSDAELDTITKSDRQCRHERKHHDQQCADGQWALHPALALTPSLALSLTAPWPSRPTSPSAISACRPPPASARPTTSIRPLRAWSSSTRPVR